MSSISASHGNPNPNLHSSVITQPSTSNPPKNSNKTKRNKRKSKNRKRGKRKPNPNWLELPEDLWFMILSKLRTIDIIEDVQKVCMLFRNLCKHPSMFKIIDMYLPDSPHFVPYDVNLMTRYAVDRSAGGLVDIHLEYLCDDETLMYIASKSKNLKCLRLEHYIHISHEGLVEALKQLPMVEEVQIIICKYSDETIEAIGHTCPLLKSFSLINEFYKEYPFAYNGEVFAIARSMPQLRHLQLIGSSMTNDGLKAILDGCPLLESLDLRESGNIDLTGDLGKRCETIKHLRLPYDSTGKRVSVEDGFQWTYSQESDYDSDFSFYGYYPNFRENLDEYDDFTVPFDYLGYGNFLDYGSSD